MEVRIGRKDTTLVHKHFLYYIVKYSVQCNCHVSKESIEIKEELNSKKRETFRQLGSVLSAMLRK